MNFSYSNLQIVYIIYKSSNARGGAYLNLRLLIIALAKFSLISRCLGIVSVSVPLMYISCPLPFLFKCQPFLSSIFIKSARFVYLTSSLHLLLYALNAYLSIVFYKYFALFRGNIEKFIIACYNESTAQNLIYLRLSQSAHFYFGKNVGSIFAF